MLILFSTEVNAQIESLNFHDAIKQTSKPNKESKPLEQKTSINFDDLIHVGDFIGVDILGSTEYDWRGKISNEGFLDGIEFTDDEIYGLCKSGKQVADEIAKSYGRFLKNPKIIVTILDRSNRPISTLYGAVKKPQQFKLKRKVYLNELIVLSGGFTEKASGQIQILRRPNTSCVSEFAENKNTLEKNKLRKEEFIKVKQDNRSRLINVKISDLLKGTADSNVQILYGDIITVKIAEPIYVIGGVIAPSKLQIREEITVSRAIFSAGGLTKNADSNKITIFRRENGKMRIIKLNLNEIIEGLADDVKLKAYDIVDVTEKGRDEKKYPPVIRFDSLEQNIFSKLPVTIIK